MNLKFSFQNDFVIIDEFQNALQLHVKIQTYAMIRDRIINDTKIYILKIIYYRCNRDDDLKQRETIIKNIFIIKCDCSFKIQKTYFKFTSV